MLACALPLMAASPPAGRLEIAVEGLRSTKGNVLICLTQNEHYFPDCSGDPVRRELTIPATEAALAHIDGIAPGEYALSLIHDENGNGKLDTRLGIPREGVGFSRNPRLMFGPPGFSNVRFTIPGGQTRTTVRVKYFL